MENDHKIIEDTNSIDDSKTEKLIEATDHLIKEGHVEAQVGLVDPKRLALELAHPANRVRQNPTEGYA